MSDACHFEVKPRIFSESSLTESTLNAVEGFEMTCCRNLQ